MTDARHKTELLLNMQMLLDNLEEDYNVTFFNRNHDVQKLVGACIYFGQKELNPSYVYLARGEMFLTNPIHNPEICRISIGSLGRENDSKLLEYSVIQVEDEANWYEVFNSVQKIFVRFHSWNQRLFQILSGGGGLYELCLAAIDFFQNPLYIHDQDFNVLAMPMWVVGMTEFMVDEHTGNMRLPLKKITQFKLNQEYIKTLSTKGAHMWNPSYNVHRVVYVNIWAEENQRYCGRLLINELNSCLKPSDFTIAEYFVEFVKIAMERNLYKTDAENTFEKLLVRLMEEEKVDDGYLLNRMDMVGWKREDKYMCFKILLEEKKLNILSVRRISSTMSSVLKRSFSFSVDNCVYTVCNLTLAGYKEEDCATQMEYLCEEAEVAVGGSFVFDDFWQIKEYYLQVDKVIQILKDKGIARGYHPFSRYVLNYIICHFTEEFHIKSVCSPAILKLDETDREKGTDYLKTLRVFFKNSYQFSATAKDLYIHRSTLTYRLEKIEELTGADLQDPDTCLYLQISLRLLDERKERGSR